MAAPARAGRCADRSGPGRASGSEGGAGLATLLIQLAVEMKPLEDELDGGGDRGGIPGRAELGDRALHPRDVQGLFHVLPARERRRDVHRRATLKCGEERVELDEREGPVEDVADGALHEPVDDALLGDLAHRLEFDLARRRRDDRGKVADAWHDARLARAERTLERRGYKVLVVGDGHTDRNAGPLRDLWRAPREL